jgi:hypothetical protein
MNGKMIGRKPLYVAVAQHKEERKARLQVIFLCTYFVGHIGKKYFFIFKVQLVLAHFYAPLMPMFYGRS